VIKEESIRINGEEIIKINDSIFTAGQRGAIYKYSIKEKKYTKIPNTDAIQIKEFATDGKTLFATTVNNGIFEYENGSFKTYEFENVKTENLLAINYLKDYGVLVSTKFGEIYTYDTKTKKLNLLYEDELDASIVGIVEDSNKNLWLNTYAGIVFLNPSTKKILRYTTKDGVYELEGNRFSTYKDPEGAIFMGSYKGLSYFNPNNLSVSSIDVQPHFTSISYFDAQENRWKIHTSPLFLKDVKEIKLPSEYQRFSATMSVFGQMNSEDVKYRYRLLDDTNNFEWFTSYSSKEILFANLAPGNYTLQVEAYDASENKIGETIELKIISDKIFYKTWWFVFLLFIVASSIIIYIFYQYKGKQILYAKNEIALKESIIKTEMMLEIHHRIKNNLQIISGLLGLQMINSSNEELKRSLRDSQSRIESIAGIHNLLYNSDNFEAFSFNENVKNIIAYYKTLFPIKVKYNLNLDGSILSIDKATPLSLLLNELINNSNKHAFANIENPEITIKFVKKDKDYLLEYSDNGNFKKGIVKKESMGMKIVDMMIKQLKGDLNIKETNGFNLTLSFS
jgi:two-component sensor histidine kinase